MLKQANLALGVLLGAVDREGVANMAKGRCWEKCCVGDGIREGAVLGKVL